MKKKEDFACFMFFQNLRFGRGFTDMFRKLTTSIRAAYPKQY